VALAKRLVFGVVGIEAIAGPSEVVIVADSTARPSWIAADMLAQAEHDQDASAICVLTHEALAADLLAELESQLHALPRQEVARTSLRRHGGIVLVDDLAAAAEVVNRLAPEHVELQVADPERLAESIRNAGALFFGAYAPEPVGDYLAGPNHVLPTSGTARFASPLGVYDFVKRTSIIKYSKERFEAVAPHVMRLAEAEGLDAHRRAVGIRLEEGLQRREHGERTNDFEPGGAVAAIKPIVRGLKPYSLEPIEAPIKLNQNESPYDLPPELKELVWRRVMARDWARYPDFVPTGFLARLARFAGWRPDGVLAGNGSNELIQALLMVTAAPGVRIGIVEPTFSLYRLQATVMGADVARVALDAELRFDVTEMARTVVERDIRVLVLCSPNNPTGSWIEPDDVRRLCEAVPALVVLDEAYHEFASSSAVPLLAECQNLAVLHTFSKAMGLAALRVGYLLGQPELVAELAKAKLPYNLNVFSLTAAETLIDHYDDVVAPAVAAIVAERERMLERLSGMQPFRVYGSAANFVLMDCGELGAQRVFDALLADGILVRDVSSYPRLDGCLRITVGTAQQNDTVLASLRRIGAAGPGAETCESS
jgi:histidinol-phosphate aminotransferase